MINEQENQTQAYDSPAQIFKILTHPVRLAILDILRNGEQCVCHMEAFLGLRQAYLSQQLIVLREAGIVTDRRDGWNIFYSVADPRIYAVLDAVTQMAPTERRPLQAKTTCPCPKCNPKPEGCEPDAC